jgi:hypothetical protein
MPPPILNPVEILANRVRAALRKYDPFSQHPTEAGNPAVDRWLEVLDSRYTLRLDLGSATQPALYVDNVGPVMGEWS